MIKTIDFGIDCAPGSPRPDTFAGSVFEYLGVEYHEPYNKFFGAWEWNVDVNMTDKEWDTFDKWMKEKMDNLYENGRIRGARWQKVTG